MAQAEIQSRIPPKWEGGRDWLSLVKKLGSGGNPCPKFRWNSSVCV